MKERINLENLYTYIVNAIAVSIGWVPTLKVLWDIAGKKQGTGDKKVGHFEILLSE